MQIVRAISPFWLPGQGGVYDGELAEVHDNVANDLILRGKAEAADAEAFAAGPRAFDPRPAAGRQSKNAAPSDPPKPAPAPAPAAPPAASK